MPLHLQPQEAALKSCFGAGVLRTVPQIHTGFRKPPGPLNSGAELGGVMAVGIVRPEAYPNTRVSAAYGYTQVPGQRVPASRRLAGPHALLMVGVPTSPAPGIGVRGNSDSGAQCLADLRVSKCDTAIALSVTGHGQAEPRLCSRVFSCAPRARTGALCNPGKGWGAYLQACLVGGRHTLHLGDWN